MNELELDDVDVRPVELGRDHRQTLGSATDAPDSFDDRISLGRPVARPVDRGAVADEATRAFLDDHPSSEFWLLGLTCSFRHLDDEPIAKAWLEVRLRAQLPSDAADPTAWSMEPLSAAASVEVSRVVKFDAALKLTSDIIPIEVGPSMSRETTNKLERQMPFIEAFREGTARPSWIFTRTEANDVRGVHRLRTMVELPAGSTARAEVSAGATLRLKFLGLIPYRANLDELPEHQAVGFGAAPPAVAAPPFS